MKATLGDKLGGQLDKFRLQLPSRSEEPKPQVGVVVPAPGTGPDPERLRKAKLLVGSPAMDKIMSQLDESQLIGEFIEWMDRKGMLPVELSSNFDFAKNSKNRLKLQQWYFEEHKQ